MFGIFKNREKESTLEVETIEKPKKEFNLTKSNVNISKTNNINKIIEEIHNTFSTEVNRLEDFSKELNSLETTKQTLIDKRDRLVKLGFTNTKECQEADVEISRLNVLQNENKEKQELLEAINYFRFKYPLYKFITDDSIRSICKKYNLIFGPVDKYIGTIPDKNIEEMDRSNHLHSEFGIIIMPSFREEGITKCSKIIAAPTKDFDTRNTNLNDFELSPIIEILDPIVLSPVYYKGKKYNLIETMWGIESTDSIVINEINN